MKYGLIVHIKTQNIGDDIQEYAMEKFLPHLDYVIDREHLDSFYTTTGEKVAALLGGWYLWKAINWPPSPFLKVLPISFHLTGGRYREIALTDYGAEWFKNFEAIGCRDEGTARLLNRAVGVESYFSGCFTLTIEPFADVNRHEKIVLVDLPKEVEDFIRAHTKKEVVLVSHSYRSLRIPKEVVDFAETQAAKEAIPLSHYPAVLDKPFPKNFYKGNWNYRRAFAEGLLRFYQGASLVVTNRLHASLPCLALGTPILMVNRERLLTDYRISSFVPYLNHTTPEDLLAEKYIFNFDEPKANPGGHEKFAAIIRKKCTDFITSCENDNDNSLIDVETWLDGQKRGLRLKRIIRKQRLATKANH